MLWILTSCSALLVVAAWGHLRPAVQDERRNPGFFTALLLYLPIGICAYIAAGEDALSVGRR